MNIDKLKSVDEFIDNFLKRPEAEQIRHAISLPIGTAFNKKSIKFALKALKKWFKVKLYVEGREAKSLETIVQEFDCVHGLGIGFSIKEAIKKGDFTYGRFLNHLLLLLESKDRKIKSLEIEVDSQKQNLLDYENSLQELMYNEQIPKEIRDKLSGDFYWLQKTIEE